MAHGVRSGRPSFIVGMVGGGHFVSHFYYLVFPPLFPLLRAEFGLNNAELGLIFSVVFLAPSALQVVVGEVVDRVGAKRIFVLGLFVTAAGTMLVGAATSYLTLLAFVVLAGVGQSAFHPADFALLEAVTDEATQGKGFGVHTFAGYLGFAAAPLVAGGLGLRYGWRAALFAVGALGIGYALLAVVTMEPVHLARLDGRDGDDDTGRSVADSFAALLTPGLLAAFAFFFVITMTTTGIQAFAVVFLVDRGFSEAIGNATLTAYLTLTAVGVLTGGVLADRFDIYRIIAVTLTVAAALVGAAVAGAVVNVVALFVLFSLMGLAHGLALPSRDSLVSEVSSAGAGRSFGFVYTGVTVGAFVSPVLLGYVIDATAHGVAFLLIAGFYLVAVGIVLLIRLGRRSGWLAVPEAV